MGGSFTPKEVTFGPPYGKNPAFQSAVLIDGGGSFQPQVLKNLTFLLNLNKTNWQTGHILEVV